jgi:hypothetical protein
MMSSRVASQASSADRTVASAAAMLERMCPEVYNGILARACSVADSRWR